MASRIIYLKLRPNNTKLPDNLYSESKKKIGGKLTRSGEPLKGLTMEEERKWLPELLQTSTTDVAFRAKCNEFWSNISIIVEPKQGTKLEIGMLESGEPIALMDYIKYRYVIKCPDVAENELALKSDPTKKYYILDPTSKQEEDYSLLQRRKDAYKTYILMTTDDSIDKVNHMFRLLTGKNPEVFDRQNKELTLETLAKTDPELFLKYAENKNLEMESLIAKAVSLEIIHKFGESYRYQELMLGDSINSTIAYLNDKKNSQIFTEVKQKMNEFSKLVKV